MQRVGQRDGVARVVSQVGAEDHLERRADPPSRPARERESARAREREREIEKVREIK